VAAKTEQRDAMTIANPGMVQEEAWKQLSIESDVRETGIVCVVCRSS
jgi:hypothetical protein